MSKPYPRDYTNLLFKKFDDKKGNAKEQVISFPDDLSVCANDLDLRLKKFSKSLTIRAYSWFVNLSARSIHSWDELVGIFCTKFFIAQCKINLVVLALKV